MPLLEGAPRLRPVTILHELQRRHPDRIDGSMRRTLEPRIRQWRAKHGLEHEVSRHKSMKVLSDYVRNNEIIP